MQPYRIVICEDHNLTTDGLRVLISANPKFVILGHASGLQELQALLDETNPHILILDINLGAEDGFTILQTIRPQYPDLKILMLTMHDDAFMVEKSRQLKANGFLLKTAGASELMAALDGVLMEPFYENPEALKKRLNGSHQRDEFVTRMKLTKREIEIIRLIVQGDKAEAISDKLFLSVHTVRTHKKNILKKIGLSSTPELVRYALKNNLD